MRWMIVVVAACAGVKGGGGDASFRVFYPDSPVRAAVGKKVFVKPVARCVYADGRDARWSMTGARIEGDAAGFAIEDGVIAGTPRRAGSWTLQVKFSGVTCAGKSYEPQLVEVTIIAA